MACLLIPTGCIISYQYNYILTDIQGSIIQIYAMYAGLSNKDQPFSCFRIEYFMHKRIKFCRKYGRNRCLENLDINDA